MWWVVVCYVVRVPGCCLLFGYCWLNSVGVVVGWCPQHIGQGVRVYGAVFGEVVVGRLASMPCIVRG